MPRINDSINFCATCFQCKYHSDITPGVDIAERLLLFVEKLSNLLLNVIAVIICYLLLLVIEMIDFWWNFMGFFCLFFHDCQCRPSSKICNHHVTSLKCFMKSWMCHIAVFVLCASLRSTTEKSLQSSKWFFCKQCISGCKSPTGVKSEMGAISILNVTFCYKFHKSHSLPHMWSCCIYCLMFDYSTDKMTVMMSNCLKQQQFINENRNTWHSIVWSKDVVEVN